MTYHAEVAREYMRNAFHSGALDISGSFESVRGFVQIFEGEMEALIAIDQCHFLTPAERARLIDLSGATAETLHHYRTWLERI